MLPIALIDSLDELAWVDQAGRLVVHLGRRQLVGEERAGALHLGCGDADGRFLMALQCRMEPQALRSAVAAMRAALDTLDTRDRDTVAPGTLLS